jgi:serine phosphatase RsbU (regulator of sigma subunit)
VLVLAPLGRDGEVTSAVLAGAGIGAAVCADMARLCQALAEGAGAGAAAAAVITEEALTSPALRALAEALAAQPPWSDFPLVILASGGRGTQESRSALLELGSFTNAMILERPLRIPSLVSAVRVALRSRERQYELRAYLREREQMQARRDELLRQQRRIAETLQLSLLEAPSAGAFPGLQISTRYVPAWTDALVGGDFYDVFGFEGKVALVVGDVVGKGLAAASHMAEVKFALRAIVREHSHPARALARLNQYVTGFEPDVFRADQGLVAVLLVVIDTRTGGATVAAAGAEPPVLVRPGKRPEAVEAGGPPIGVAGMDMPKDVSYDTARFTLHPGDMLFLTTDGITEARRGRAFLGIEGLLRVVQQARQQPGATLDSIAESIVGEARGFSGGSFRDDVCLLAARWSGLL